VMHSVYVAVSEFQNKSKMTVSSELCDVHNDRTNTEQWTHMIIIIIRGKLLLHLNPLEMSLEATKKKAWSVSK